MKRRAGSRRPVKDQRATKRRPRKARVAPATAADLREQVATLTLELKEARAHQAATGEILASLTGSITDAKPVFDAIVRNLQRLFDTRLSMVQLLKDGVQYLAAAGDEEYDRLARNFPRPLDYETGSGRAILAKRVIQFAPVLGNPEAPVVHQQFARELGFNSAIFAPMLQGDCVIGVISTARREAKPFDEREIALIKAFADQAVIAIENTRLLNDLRESLQQQTATADVLKVISRSAFDLQAVLNTLVESACRLCDAEASIIWRPEGDAFKLAANFGQSAAHVAAMQRYSHRPGRETCAGRVLLEGRPVQIPDCEADPEYKAPDVLRASGNRAILGVPLLREGLPIGVLTLTRSTTRPFTEKQIELATIFADQAVIAIENVRLFEEVQARTRDLSESLQQQIATADVLRIISASLGELEPVFNAILQNATRICEAKFGTLYRFDGLAFYHAAGHGTPDALIEAQKRQGHFVPEPGTLMHRVMQTRAAAHSADYTAESALGLSAKFGGARSTVVVPMLKDNELIGAFAIYRQEVRPFTDKQIALLENFAAQAVIAIENARLLNELRSRTHELAASLDNLRATQDRLVQTQKLALLGQLTAGIAHEIKNPLNFVNNFSGISAELIDELQDTLKGIPLDDKARTEINELTDTLKSNFDKVVHHGRRADAIVKNMLQHSREGSGEHRVVDINGLVEESLNLAWHGARAETQGFEIKLKQSFDPSAGEADIFPQDIRRALLNMISNGFYAATTRRRAQNNSGDYEPTLTASTKNLGDRVEISIRDNGTGMPPDVKEKMFNPFFTTKPTGEGTGLGLSISHDIIVKQHGGSIEVDTQPGEFTEIRVILPRVAVFV
jgi:signal transduction histidine kinase